MLRYYLTTLSLLLLLTHDIHAQSFLRTHGKAIVNEAGDTVLLRGMGLGGWMLQEGYMLQTAAFANAQHQIRAKIEALIGPDDTQAFYDAWLANHVRKSDIDSLAAWGFNCVRLPMHYNLYTLPVEEEPVPGQHTWLDKGFELTDSLIAWCKAHGMYVLLDLHAAPGGQGQDEGISDYDPSKPSLWESEANREKTAALWKKLAERYADEPAIMGYDLLNEPNWPLPGNALLRQLYERITDSIRSVDTVHMIFIEGNWFANDFTGLTPPWDDNMVYSPHKYWSFNDPSSIQWALNIRDTYDVPVFFGEAGENSNTWFRDAIRLFESEGLGWAWWPLKKVESISCPLSVVKPAGYQQLLDFWSGNGPMPTPAEAKDALMALADNLKTEHCVFQPDVIDAMFRQVYDSTAIPYRGTHHLPGTLQPTDFDMGLVGIAWYDTDVANYHVSTGNYTAWNQGWAYRNDGVDIEKTGDPLNDHGYHVAWTEAGEWMQYDVVVDQGGVYDIDIRVASATGGGVIHLEADGTDLTGFRYLPNTGGWQLWQTYTISNVILDAGPQKLRLYVDAAGNNLGPLEFSYQGPSTSVNARFISAVTHDEHTIRLTLSKPIAAPLPPAPAGFSLYDDGVAVPVTAVVQDADHPRVLWLTTTHTFTSEDEINVSYDEAAGLVATDGTPLSGFLFRIVTNTLPVLLDIPGRIEAEAFFRQSGIQTEPTTDAGGGLNIGFLDPGDYADYYVRVAEPGLYRVDYRTASESATGGLALQLIDDEDNPEVLHTVAFAPTGGWQTWATTSAEALLPQGIHRLRIFITQPSYNLNWMDFTLLATDTRELQPAPEVLLYPNPASSRAWLAAAETVAPLTRYAIFNAMGQQVWQQGAPFGKRFRVELPVYRLEAGIYLVQLDFADGTTAVKRLVVQP